MSYDKLERIELRKLAKNKQLSNYSVNGNSPSEDIRDALRKREAIQSSSPDAKWNCDGNEDMFALKNCYKRLEENNDRRLGEFLGYVRHTCLADLPTQTEFALIIRFFDYPEPGDYAFEWTDPCIAVPMNWDFERANLVREAKTKNLV